jgi:O-antigen/teichoic acid export membrane protein
MRIARQSVGSLGALVVGLATSILLSRILGAELRGEYALAVTLAGLVLAVSQCGIAEVLLYVYPEQRQRSGAVIGTSLGVGLLATVAVAIVVGLIAPLLGSSLLRDVDPVLIALALGGSAASLLGLFSRRFLQLDGRLAAYNWLDTARNLLFLAAAVGLASGLPNAALGAMLGWLIAELAIALAGLVLLRFRPEPQPVRPEPVEGRLETSGPDPMDTGTWTFDSTMARNLLVSGLPIQLGLLATFLGNEGGRYVLNAALDSVAVGIYVVALSVARLVLQVSMALRTVLQSRLAQPGESETAELTQRVARHGLLWMLAVSVGLAIGSPLMPWVFGSDFASAGPVLLWLLPGMLGYGVCQLLTGYLLRKGERKVLAVSSWAFAIASIGLQAVGIASYGVLGAAMGLSAAYFVMAAVVVTAYLKSSGEPAGRLVPGPSDFAFYLRLARR